jgi:ribokinase
MIEVLSIGSLTLDLFFQDSSLTLKKNRFNLALGGKYVVGGFNQGIGGGGGNVAVGLSRAGLKAALWAQIGQGGVSMLITHQLKEEGVVTDYLAIEEEFANVSAILLSTGGERTIINHRSGENKLILLPKHRQLLEQVKAVYLGNLPEVPLELRVEILSRAKQNKKTTFLNLGVKDCRRHLRRNRPLLEVVDYFIINRYELADLLTMMPNELMPSRVNYQKRLFPNSETVLVITDGEFGSYGQTKDTIIHQLAYKVPKVIDATGAGDAFTSGFISAVLSGFSLKDSLRCGARNSSSVISKVNAQKGLLFKAQLFG